MVLDAVKNYLTLASGITEVTRQRAIAAARALAASGETTAEQVQTLAEDLIATSRSNREAASALVKLELDRALARVGLASAEEVTALSARVQRLEAALRTATSSSGGGAATKAPATKAPAKKAPAKKAPAKKAAAKKAPAKSSATAPAKQSP
jgi:polyhydroxyalkanoate synthesis regulator phasin